MFPAHASNRDADVAGLWPGLVWQFAQRAPFVGERYEVVLGFNGANALGSALEVHLGALIGVA